jgi:hypothetical protein
VLGFFIRYVSEVLILRLLIGLLGIGMGNLGEIDGIRTIRRII